MSFSGGNPIYSVFFFCCIIRHLELGPDWEWDNQDGGVGKIGSVLNVQGSGIVLVRISMR